ncbi:MAG: hypothetical protein REI09_12315 [Candidatus Dactylopiibacterium sp.]|nr:hypothetical protein [Candidatus Dactylopiibacterium sp.]
MSTVESAYQTIAMVLHGSADSGWQKIVFKTSVLSKNCSGMQTSVVDRAGRGVSVGLGMSKGFAVSDEVVFLRDNILETTGQRIWGLSFTLYPDGKFDIEYDYDKPEGYEETDETVSGDEASSSLGGLLK